MKNGLEHAEGDNSSSRTQKQVMPVGHSIMSEECCNLDHLLLGTSLQPHPARQQAIFLLDKGNLGW